MRNFYLDEKDLLEHVRRRLNQDKPQAAPPTSSQQKPEQRSLWRLVGSLSARFTMRGPSLAEPTYTLDKSLCCTVVLKEREQHAR